MASANTADKPLYASITSRTFESSLTPSAATKSITYYKGVAGEEISDYTQLYSGGALVKSAVYFYGLAKSRAGSTYYGAPVSQVNNYQRDKDVSAAAATDTNKLVSQTFYNIKDSSNNMRISGEEYIDYVVNYESNGATVYYKSVYFYGTDINNLKYSNQVNVSSSDPLAASVSFYNPNIDVETLRNNIPFIGVGGGLGIYPPVLNGNLLRNIAFYKGARNEEKTWYQLQYQPQGANKGVTVSKTTVYLYGSSEFTAGSGGVNQNTALYSSLTFDGDKTSDITGGANMKTYTTNRRSYAFYTGPAGEEMTDYAWSYSSTDGTKVMGVSQYFYGDAYLAAASASSGNDRLSKIVQRSVFTTADLSYTAGPADTKYGQYLISETRL
jgi:hypothetical protein